MEFMFNHHQNNLEFYMSEYKDSLEMTDWILKYNVG